MAERAGYTVTMFLVDVSPSMGNTREVEVPQPNGEVHLVEMTNLEWALQFVKLKVQEMIYNGRKTDQCGVILFGTDETRNIVNKKDGGYDHVYEYVPIGTPNADTVAKITSIAPSEEIGDPIDALIVGIETQDKYLGNKKTWTRKIVLLTDGENPMEIEDWEATAAKMNSLKARLTIVGIDFDDEEYGYVDEEKSDVKRANEEFYHTFVEKLESGIVGNAAFAIEEISRPEVKQTKSALQGNILRLGDVENHPDQAIEIVVKTSKCTALQRPKSWKKFALIPKDDDDDILMNGEQEEVPKAQYGEVVMETEYLFIPPKEAEDGEEEDEDTARSRATVIDKEDLVRGFKYGASFVPCAEGSFLKLETKKGIDFCGFFYEKLYRRELAMSEVQFVWADPASPLQQVALSSIVQAMYIKSLVAIARWVSRDGAEPKMGILRPVVDDDRDFFMWVQVPFADDVRRYTFPSLDKLINKKGEIVKEHPYIPTNEQMDAMAEFVDAMDLMEAGEKDEDGERGQWFETSLSYNPAIHRTKQAQFHAAIVSDLNKHPLPPPHSELLKYFEPPRRVVKRAKEAVAAAKEAFNVKEVPKRVARARKDGHVRARDEGDDTLLIDKQPAKRIKLSKTQSQYPRATQTQSSPSRRKVPRKCAMSDDSETEPEDDEYLIIDSPAKPTAKSIPKSNIRDDTPMDTGDIFATPASESQLWSQLDSQTQSQTQVESVDPAPGRIIRFAAPLEDFGKNIASGDLVTKAVEDLAFVVQELVFRPFSAMRHPELLDCMKELRRVCLEEDEIDAWNEFLPELKTRCIKEEPGNTEFWDKVSALGRGMSLISKSEAAKQHGKSDISDAKAVEFIRASN